MHSPNLTQENIAPIRKLFPECVIEAKGVSKLLLNNSASFPFQYPVMTGVFISQRSDWIIVVRYGLGDEFLKLKDQIN